jgi:hypothetical protein
MGKRAQQERRETRRVLRDSRLTEQEKEFLKSRAAYEGSPHHKRNPGDFRLTPPSAPRIDKTLCDEAGIFKVAKANEIFAAAIDRGIISVAEVGGFPKQMWAVADGQVFEAMLGGSIEGRYHGYPIRKSDPLHDLITNAWKD